MAPVTNGRALFAAVPIGYPVVDQTIVYDNTQTIDLANAPLNGGFLVKVLVLSVDPYMRGRMREPDIPSYMPPFALGKPLASGGIGVVLRSELAGVEVGSHIRGIVPHQEYFIAPNLEGLELIERDARLPWSVYVGAAGMPGETAYMAWKEYSKAKKGEIVFVTTGAGPVGSLVIQIAKQDGLKVIASAGSDDKVAFMEGIGADVAFNYKTTDVRAVLKKEGPIDIYWDNVGGDTLDAAMEHANMFARFIECGQISGYNDNPQPMKNPLLIVAKCLTFNGFLVGFLRPKHKEAFRAEVVPKIADGSFHYTEDIVRGIDKVGHALLGVLKGTNTGKAVVVVADE
ncbi:PKS-ER domain-containing protein [Mycena indigotica]|uniref:PKS-ER domain-containing protein n=1 Tax=Mycena indigotica TaxID=2126181 RepID=A0A8H6SDC2_9AGAR|nr:PKS-ER domain-containing protein [Mycena indigotica]KAF7297373.1 PKS-ER domain-containing protein [Mycena indigotica]